MSIFLDVMKEELERNLYKQKAFEDELLSLPKGYLSVCVINGKKYIYRKQREKNKICSQYIGVPDDKAVEQAYKDRELYVSLKQSLKILKIEEKKLRRAIKSYV